jgi:hypothetical protein
VSSAQRRKPLTRYGAMQSALARGLLHISKHKGVSSSCRQGVGSGCRLTIPRRLSSPALLRTLVTPWPRMSSKIERRLVACS